MFPTDAPEARTAQTIGPDHPLGMRLNTPAWPGRRLEVPGGIRATTGSTLSRAQGQPCPAEAALVRFVKAAALEQSVGRPLPGDRREHGPISRRKDARPANPRPRPPPPPRPQHPRPPNGRPPTP